MGNKIGDSESPIHAANAFMNSAKILINIRTPKLFVFHRVSRLRLPSGPGTEARLTEYSNLEYYDILGVFTTINQNFRTKGYSLSLFAVLHT